MSALEARLADHLQQIARERDPYLATAGHFSVQQYVRSQLAAWGTVEQHDFQYRTGGRVHHNLVLNLPAQDSPAAKAKGGCILVGAHYDAVPGTPGADDNASGVAVLLELARWFAAHPARYPVRLIAFDLEEYGMQGSTAYAEQVVQTGEPIRLMLSLEMLGYFSQAPQSQTYPAGLQFFYPDQGDFIALIGTVPTIPEMLHLRKYLRQATVPCQWLPAGWQGKLVAATRLSDHAPFWDRGDRAIMVTDTAFLRNPHYHQPSDRIDTLDLQRMACICEGLAAALQHLT